MFQIRALERSGTPVGSNATLQHLYAMASGVPFRFRVLREGVSPRNAVEWDDGSSTALRQFAPTFYLILNEVEPPSLLIILAYHLWHKP